MKIQPGEFIVQNGLGWYAGNAVKYICRHRMKGGRLDIEKAIHYLELLLEDEYETDKANTESGSNPNPTPVGQYPPEQAVYPNLGWTSITSYQYPIGQVTGSPEQVAVGAVCNCEGCKWARGDKKQW